MARTRLDRDYYAILGLHPEATEEEIRRAYRRLALEWHPDQRPGDPRAAERFKEISEAYAVLINAPRRREYDQARQAGAAGSFRHTQEDLFRDLFTDPRADLRGGCHRLLPPRVRVRLGSYPETVSAAARSVEGRFPAAVPCHASTRTAVQMRVASAGPLWWATRRR
jgi:curved DNA-binding protein CbpA